MVLRSILCPIDFSEPSRQALRLAGALAARFESRLLVLSVVDPLLAEAAQARLKLDLAKEETGPALAAFVKATFQGQRQLAPQPVVEVRVGNASDVIVDTAASDAADVIVMGTQGLGGFRKWLLGSTTERVLRRTRTPVLAVPPVAPVGALPFGAGPVLAATDFTESSIEAADSAATLARKFNVPFLLAHVVEPVTVPPQWTSLLEESDEARIADARRGLKLLAGQFPGSPAPETLVSFGQPADAIAALAEERGVGLIVMGLVGEQGAFARRPGSIAYRVLCTAGVPVLVVPPAAGATA